MDNSICVTVMRKSKLSQSIIAIFKSRPTTCFSLCGIATELGKTIDRKSSARISLSRCLNRMHREGLVDYEYLELYPDLFEQYGKSIPDKHAGKYWKLKTTDAVT
jgi:hypothetical protein